VPELGEQARHSGWIGEIPGLARAVAAWEHDLGGNRSLINDRTRRVARPGLLPPGRVIRQSAALTSAPLGWMLRRLPEDLGTRRPLEQTGEWLQDSAGYLLREQLANLGPAAAELARIIVDSEGIVPDFVVGELRRRPVPDAPLPLELAERIVEQALPVGLGRLGTLVSSTPVSQLHEAELKDGTPVLVRVGRPEAGREVRQDARIAATVLGPFETLVPIFAAVRPLGLVELIGRQLAEGSDMRNEALNAVELGLLIERLEIERLAVCRPLPGLVTARAAVFEAPAGGFPLRGIAAGSEDDDGSDPARRRPADSRPLGGLVLESALAAGVFAANMRAEQVAVLPDGRLCVTGCGAVGRLDLTTRRALLDLLPALLSGDTARQVAALHDLGIAPAGQGAEDLLAELAEVQPSNPFVLLGGQGGGMAALGRDAIGIMLRHGVTPPLELVQLARAVLALRTILRCTRAPGGLLATLVPLVGRFSALRADLE
jgi:ubiquinone biosynthesis protein